MVECVLGPRGIPNNTLHMRGRGDDHYRRACSATVVQLAAEHAMEGKVNKAHEEARMVRKLFCWARDQEANRLMLEFASEWKEHFYVSYYSRTGLKPETMTDREFDSMWDARDEVWEHSGCMECIAKVEARLNFHWKAGREFWTYAQNAMG